MNLYQIAQFIFNFIKADMSEVFNDMFMYNSDVRHYDTRQSHLLHIPHVSSNQRKRTRRYEGPVHREYKLLIVFIQKQLKLFLWNV